MYNILLCDDERDIVSALKIYLTNPEYSFFEAYNGEEALKILREEKVDLVLMDIMMPELDGINALSKIREFSNVPVIFLTAKSEYTDKVLGLNLGADDYVTKPFNPVELIARVKSQLRRYTLLGSAPKSIDSIRIDGIELLCESKKVTVDGEPVQLTPKEYEILKFLMMNPGICFSPSEIYRKVWGDVPIGVDNAIAVHIRHIREKIEIDPASPRYLKVAWGRGYKFEKSVSE
ncbi:MAG TPA: response regulator transcription factor [Candidatus Faeciplasma pullistercoris]|uniref:Stage 0 sporulation protein A homolog n=1 Tax=Candidatus Faeciplasma pullistercoris TaxID=2840800 RepID=A0A9D1GUY9_9FIRM|nr:response regulator transcription factor [Candidatus Faeciplasma pullistercoris]